MTGIQCYEGDGVKPERHRGMSRNGKLFLDPQKGEEIFVRKATGWSVRHSWYEETGDSRRQKSEESQVFKNRNQAKRWAEARWSIAGWRDNGAGRFEAIPGKSEG